MNQRQYILIATNNVTMDKRTYRCGYCNELLGNFDEETLSLCMIALETFVHREPAMAAPQLFRFISTVTRCAALISD